MRTSDSTQILCSVSAKQWCMLVNLLKSSILKVVVGFCLVLQESEEQRSRELHLLCEQVPKECPSIGRNFIPFFCNWQMYISPALFMNSLDIFSFFVINIKQSAVSVKTYFHFLLTAVFRKESFYSWRSHFYSETEGGLPFYKVWIFVVVKTISILVHIVFVSSLTLLHKLVFSCVKNARNWNERSWLVHQWKCPLHQIPCPLKATNHNSGLSLRPCEYYMT